VRWLRFTFVEPGRASFRPSSPPRSTWPWRSEHAPPNVARALGDKALRWSELDLDQRFGLVEAAGDPHALERYTDTLSISRRGSIVA